MRKVTDLTGRASQLVFPQVNVFEWTDVGAESAAKESGEDQLKKKNFFTFYDCKCLCFTSYSTTPHPLTLDLLHSTLQF